MSALHFIVFDAAKFWFLLSAGFAIGWVARSCLLAAHQLINAQRDRDSVAEFAHRCETLSPDSLRYVEWGPNGERVLWPR